MDQLDKYLDYAAEQYQPSGIQTARMMKKVYRVQQKARRESGRTASQRRNEELLCWVKGLFTQPFEQK